MPDDEEPTESDDEPKQSWFQKRKAKKIEKERASRMIREASAEQEWKRSNLKTKEGEPYKPTQEQMEYEYALKKEEREQKLAEMRKRRFAREHPFVTRSEDVVMKLGRESLHARQQTARYVRDKGREMGAKGSRQRIKRQQRIPAVARQGVTSYHDASAPTGMELGIAMEFGQPRQREYTSPNRQDMFVGGQGGQIEQGTRPTIQPTTRPTIIQPQQVQEQPRQMDFFGPSQNRDFFGNKQTGNDILGSGLKGDNILGKRKKQNYW